ncbi:DUF6443 domain-containing protein [Chryseobacterium lathyri]|jgi:RHS repeat-associated protein|uniref:DUF6443 domain-containing protein n=1 Tax=Chryseobacterium lathyri TaxID=395933 RepID=A0A511Y4S2_9FLAO|nr:DUF6443 domain-containing protein [Chryseobacterium lathyri]GEN70165.1 hypothetical protein CLA01_02370 [Chryseobacterium lathyri]
MQKILIPIGALLVTSLAHAQLSSTENYVYSKTYLDYNGTTPTKTSETVQYFDGLGRPKQIVNVKASPLGRDIVTHIEHDQFGRKVKDYLPVPQSQTLNGSIVPTPLANATQPGIYGSEKIYAEKILENSPLDRIQQQIQVGNDWTGKPINFDYDANIDSEVKRYIATSAGATSSAITLSGTYGASQLYKNTITDEDGNKTIEFKNGQGQVLLVRKVVSSTENADTYYVYNEYNQLAFVIPPKASATADLNTVLGSLCYMYRYDGRNRLVLKKLPGKGWEYMVYDKQDRLIMTQDAVMGAQKQWLFTKYDQFGRIAYTGIYTSAQAYGVAGRAAEQALADAKGSNNVTRTSTAGFTNSGLDVYYDNGSFSYPSSVTKLLSVNYYDTYPTGSPTVTNVFAQELLTDNPSNSRTTKGMLTASYVKNIEDDQWTKNFIWYDTKGRNIGSRSNNHLGGYTVVNHKLDFAGMVLQTNTYHKRLSTDAEKGIAEKFTYDHQNRLLTHTHQIGSNPVEYLAQNKYNELSQLESKKVGGVSLASPLQTIDYKYNIRGWMTNINDPANLGTDLFGYKINYNQVEGLEVPDASDTGLMVKPKYNGNIAEVSWKTLTQENEPLKRYGYVYDPINRLTAGFYQSSGNETGREYFEKLEYDLNGNITRLKRSEGLLPGSTTALMIDNLKYDYVGNQLTKVSEEQIGNSKGYPYVVTPTIIGYDLNGNMLNHKDKGISSIQYNYLNLPKQITQNAQVTNYVYRADGVKVKKLFGDIETNYLDGFQYKSTRPSEEGSGGGLTPEPDPNEVATIKLRIIPTSEGYYDVLSNSYIYNFTDHLGNVRLSYTDTNKDGIIQPRQYRVQQCDGPWDPWNPPNCIDYWTPGEIVEVNNYYPFGLMHNYTATTQNAYQYKYNGKELQETGMYDYGARFYMPDIGRWGVVDPLAEKHPELNPMMYAANNPIVFIDPDGRDWGITQTYDKKTNTTHYQITFTGAVLNSSSNKKIDMKKFASTVQSQTEAIFNKIDNNPNITVSANINIRTIDDKEDLKSTDTLIEIKDSSSKEFDVYKDKKTDVVGRAMNGKEIYVNEKYINDLMSGENSKTLPHEIGHTGGLQHPAMATRETLFDLPETFSTLKSNFMIQGAIRKPTGLNVHQINRMYRLYKAGKLNNRKIEPRLEK